MVPEALSRRGRDTRGYATLGSIVLIAGGVLALLVLLLVGLTHLVARWETVQSGGPLAFDAQFLSALGMGLLVALGGTTLGAIGVWIRLSTGTRY